MTTVPTTKCRAFGIALQVLIAIAALVATIFFTYLLLHEHPTQRITPTVQPHPLTTQPLSPNLQVVS
ncbi:hypothetical protein [Nocardia transvalensis]|uniref:hypothetical protein n=1 Tax=Nocardia transvalensis TaxID=37333 RepID=UPI001895574C|nr:hypothetical protein [Nocardia transvalensis]MBF6334021.1 hypothetical protein [Nocardia transvalensis]